jgi:tRNA pseudouridine38-40 synthase
MTRIALGLEYDGTEFIGWQTQRAGRSVQSVLAEAVSRVANERVAVRACGRTDAGVHASYQVVDFDTAASRRGRQWVLGINSNLPADVAVHWAKQVPDEFDARRSALARRYRYLFQVCPVRPVLLRRRAWWMREPLDCAAMLEAGVHWLGERDFSAFRAAGCQSSTAMRRMISVGVRRRGRLVGVEFTANAFLLHMVRNMAGVLAEIGRGKAEPIWAAEVLAGRDRRRAGVTAPPWGLTLADIEYPQRFELPAATDEWHAL